MLDKAFAPLGAAMSQVAAATTSSMHAGAQAMAIPTNLAAEGLEAAIDASPPRVKAFLADNSAAINRTLGLLQMGGGAAEVVAGGAAVADSAGLAAAAGAWMVAQGASDWDTGLKMLVSGSARESTFTSVLRDWGFTREQADGIVATTSGLSAAQLAGATRSQIAAAADRTLELKALDAFRTKGTVTTADGSSLANVFPPAKRGDLYEAYIAKETGFLRTPAGHKTFDLFPEDRALAVSAKTLIPNGKSYMDTTRSGIYYRLKGYIDDVADYKQDRRRNVNLYGWDLKERHLDLGLLAQRPTPGQEGQLEAALNYAKSRGVNLRIRYIH